MTAPRAADLPTDMLFDRILVPLDGSALAEAMLPQVGRILRRKDSEVLLLRAAPTGGYPAVELSVGAPQELRDARDYVARVADALNREGAAARGLAAEGPPAGVILETAEREKATLIAMATHGRSGLSLWVFGSVTEKVLRASPVPLLILRSFGRNAPVPAPLEFRRILVPVLPYHLGVVPLVKEFAELFGSSVQLLHVVDPAEGPADPSFGPRLAAVAHSLRESGIAVEIRERAGDPAREILAAASEDPVELIALSSHGRAGPSPWALGSVAEKVLHAAAVPLLVLRA